MKMFKLLKPWSWQTGWSLVISVLALGTQVGRWRHDLIMIRSDVRVMWGEWISLLTSEGIGVLHDAHEIEMESQTSCSRLFRPNNLVSLGPSRTKTQRREFSLQLSNTMRCFCQTLNWLMLKKPSSVAD